MNNQLMNKQNTMTIVSAVSALAIGALIGAGIALLVAPQSGKKTRKMIEKRGKALGNDIKDMAMSSATRTVANKAIDNLSQQAKSMNPFNRANGKQAKNFVDQQVCRVQAKIH